ncbi:hypothetical protein WP50_04425 [Lactiplantibacillus plantarum]|nr:hypothetical protein WP50_04425 [Lactiplantibacillus plantarum]
MYEVALSKLSLLGTSPISSIPNVISNITAIPIGQLTIAFIFILVLLEAIVLRRQFSWQNLLQLTDSRCSPALVAERIRALAD